MDCCAEISSGTRLLCRGKRIGAFLPEGGNFKGRSPPFFRTGRRRAVSVSCDIGPCAGTAVAHPEPVPEHLLQGQAVPLVQPEEEPGNHDEHHEGGGVGHPHGVPGEEVHPQPQKSRGKDAQDLPPREIEGDLVLHPGEIPGHGYECHDCKGLLPCSRAGGGRREAGPPPFRLDPPYRAPKRLRAKVPVRMRL